MKNTKQKEKIREVINFTFFNSNQLPHYLSLAYQLVTQLLMNQVSSLSAKLVFKSWIGPEVPSKFRHTRTLSLLEPIYLLELHVSG